MDAQEKTYLQSIAEEVIAKYQRLHAIIGHGPSIGGYHEAVLREVFGRTLPSTFKVEQGFFLDKDANPSSQIDFMIVDQMDPRAYIFNEGEFCIAADHAVTTIGEVKTTATPKEFKDALIKLTKNLMMVEDSGRMTSFMFCYDMRVTKETFFRWVNDEFLAKAEELGARPFHLPDVILCLKKGILIEKTYPENGSYMQYMNRSPSGGDPTKIQEYIISLLFQAITNGAGRTRKEQGVILPNQTT